MPRQKHYHCENRLIAYMPKYGTYAPPATSLNDPSGLDFYLTCSHTDQNAQTCQQVDNGGQKDWVQGTTPNGQFAATVISNGANGTLVDQNGNQYAGTFNQDGVTFNLGKTTSSGVFENGSNPTTLSGSGIFQGFTGVFNDNCGGTCMASGGIEGSPGAFAVLMDVLSHSRLEDTIDVFHWGAKNYRYPTASGPSPHIVDRRSTRGRGFDAFHFDTSYPYATVPGFFDHAGSVSRSIGHVFTGPHPLPAPEELP